MADIRSTQNIAQVEWADPPIMKVTHVFAQVEYSETGPTTQLIDLSTEIAVANETQLIDLSTEIAANAQTLQDLLSEISAAAEIQLTGLNTEIAANAQTIEDLSAEINAGVENFEDLETEISANAQTISDLNVDIEAKAYSLQSLNTSIMAIRSKWWLNTEIIAGCSAKFSFDTEWDPNRFLSTEIEAKKPYTFSFNTTKGLEYAATSPEIEILISGYPRPLRTLFLDYLRVGTDNEYSFQIWFSRGLTGKNPLKNAKIKAEYINALNSGGYEVVTCDWLSIKVDGGEYQTLNETPLNLGDIPCDSKLSITLKVDCRDCSVTRGLVFFRLVIIGDYKEILFGAPVVYQDGALYHAGEFDDFSSNNFIARLYVVG